MPPLKEACVESLAEAKKATFLGADRLELCARLDLDGISPSIPLVQQVLQAVDIPVRVMIRPRVVDFCFTLQEKEQCFKEIEALKQLGVEGIVIGATTLANELDIPFLMTCFAKVQPLNMTIHKAIDVTPNPISSLQKLLKTSYTGSVLSSGGASTATEGIENLSQMLQFAKKRITIIPAGRITTENFEAIHQALGASIYHGRQIVGNLNL